MSYLFSNLKKNPVVFCVFLHLRKCLREVLINRVGKQRSRDEGRGWWGWRWIGKRKEEVGEERRWREEECMASSPTSCWLIRSYWAASPESCMHAGLTHPQAHTCDSSESRTRSLAAIVVRCNKRNSICQLCYCISNNPWRGFERMNMCSFWTADFQHNKKYLIYSILRRPIFLKSNWPIDF